MKIQRDGFTILPAIVSQSDCDVIGNEVESTIQSQHAGAIETMRGQVVGSRNLIDHWDGWQRIVRHRTVVELIDDQVSRSAGVVRILYFDKPPGQSWSLSLHRDQTIAVAKHGSNVDPFCKPTTKAGVPHVVATEELLQSMLTLRLHLDPMTSQNGPVTVVPGSHLIGESEHKSDCQTIECDAGDLFVMRPLLLHGSRASEPTSTMHRRVVHLEIAPHESLPGEYRWHRFQPIGCGS